MARRLFVPADFAVPERLEHRDFILRPLVIGDLVKDYDAVMTSADRITSVFSREHKWPRGLTLEADLVDLGWHQKEFQQRSSFAYTMMTPDEATCLGCAYLYPSYAKPYDAVAYCWVRSSAPELDAPLYAELSAWLARDWPFKNVAFPGRAINWDEWEALNA